MPGFQLPRVKHHLACIKKEETSVEIIYLTNTEGRIKIH